MVRKGGVLAIVAALAVGATGCGTREEQVVIADPVAEALAHAPADAPVLAVVATDTAAGPAAALARLGRRFPGMDLVLGQAQATLGARVGLDYATELRPLLGHPLVLWSVEGLVAGPRFAAWVVRDSEKLGGCSRRGRPQERSRRGQSWPVTRSTRAEAAAPTGGAGRWSSSRRTSRA